MSDSLQRVDEIYRDRGQRARELKAEGKGIIGYLCTFTPIEIIAAAGLVPYRLTGSAGEAISVADKHLETIACPYTRSILDLTLKGKYDFLDGFVMPHSCDNVVNLYNVFASSIAHSYAHFVNVPHTLSAPSIKFFAAELGTFKRSLEKYTGREITAEDLRTAIGLYNEQRALVRELYAFRKQAHPPISGTEMTRVVVAVMSLPVAEANALLRSLIIDVGNRGQKPEEVGNAAPRLMIHGTGNDETTFLEIVEGAGARVVVDDLCFGTRSYWFEVPRTDDPLVGLAETYLDKIRCPRTYRQSPGTHEEDLENRFGHIYEMASEFGVKAVILYLLRYCDTHAFDAPDLKEYLQGKGLPVLQIEEDYPTSSVGRLKTRVQAFLETLAD
jgi:bzd-type benzoyl-CoA reductase N subunit